MDHFFKVVWNSKNKKAHLALTAFLFFGALPYTYFYSNTSIQKISNLYDGQIIQRNNNGNTSLIVKGRVGFLASKVEWAASKTNTVTPGDWNILDDSPGWTRFQGEIELNPGWHRIYLRSRGQRGVRIFKNIQLGVGDVFIVAGQSNAAGSAQTLFISDVNQVRKAQVSSYGKLKWMRADDPQVPGGLGSVWPLVGSMLYNYSGVPVGFINVSVGGSSIKDWQKHTRNYKRLISSINLLKPQSAYAVLWHQGESDQLMDEFDYLNLMKSLIQDSRKDTQSQIPWMVSQCSYSKGKVSGSLKKAQKQTWADGIAWEGPNTDLLPDEFRHADNVHFNEMGTRKAAELWFEKIKIHLQPFVAPEGFLERQ